MVSHRHHRVGRVIGWMVAGVLAVFLLTNLGAYWPLCILIPGLLLLVRTLSGGRNGAPLAVPAVLISGTGAILLYQSTSRDWASWAYVWTLYPALLGVGMILMGRLESRRQTIRSGRRLLGLSLAAFVGFWLLYRVTIFSGLISTLAIPLLLIGLILVWLLRTVRHSGAVHS